MIQDPSHQELAAPSLQYEFAGQHLLASYMNCELAALCDAEGIVGAMERAVAATGATLLHISHHVFPGGGVSAAALLGESHASVHTYPEHRACFIDIFTCGTSCIPEKFDDVLRGYFTPRSVQRRILQRSAEGCRELQSEQAASNW